MSEKAVASRRDFLKIGACALAGAGIGTLVNKIMYGPTNLPTDLPTPESTALPEEEQIRLKEIREFRKTLGMDSDPPEMAYGLTEQNKWPDNNKPFDTSGLPLKNLSYGMYIEDVTSRLFGANATQLIRGCRTDPIVYGAMAFNDGTRECILPENVHTIPIDTNFIDFILHEAGGHGSDPCSSFAGKYPRDVFIHVEHGKWQALSSMFDVKDQFLNNPGDLMYPILKRGLGKVVGQEYVDSGNISQLFDVRGQNKINSLIESIALSQRVKVNDLKFNKSVCREIGAAIVPDARAHKLTMKGNLRTTYDGTMEWVGAEIYAEMVKYSILYPELIGHNNIATGISEILSAINGKPVNLAAIRNHIFPPNPEIMARNAAEIQVEQVQEDIGITPTLDTAPPTQDIPTPVAPTLSPEEQAIIDSQQNEHEEYLSTFDAFIYKGTLPDSLIVSGGKARRVREFADLYSRINIENPELIYQSVVYDEGFDLNMHLWDMEELFYAINVDFIRGLIQAGEVSDQIYGEITKKVDILKRFTGIHIWP
jgi:hypothetical protein